MEGKNVKQMVPLLDLKDPGSDSSTEEYKQSINANFTVSRLRRLISLGEVDELRDIILNKFPVDQLSFDKAIDTLHTFEPTANPDDVLAKEYMSMVSPHLGVNSLEKMSRIIFVADLLWKSADDITNQGICFLVNDVATLQFLLQICRQISDQRDDWQNILNEQDCNGDTPLHVHCREGREKLVEYLVSDDNIPYSKDCSGEDVPLKCEQVLTDTKNNMGECALFDAIRSKNPRIIELMVQCTDNLAIKNKKMNTPLHIACEDKSSLPVMPQLITSLCKKAKSLGAGNDYLKNNEGFTPLDIACRQGQVELVEVLLANSEYMALEEELNEMHSAHKRTIPLLHHVCQKEGRHYLRIAQMLYKYDNKVVEKINLENDTALHCAARAGLTSMVDWLIAMGADPSSANDKAETPMHLACKFGHVTVAYDLYNAHRRCMVHFSDNKTPFDFACVNGQAQVVSTLLSDCIPLEDKTIDILSNKKEYGFLKLLDRGKEDNISPMQLVAQKGDVAVMKAILEHIHKVIDDTGGEIEILPVYPTGKSPLEIAFNAGRDAAVTLFLEDWCVSSVVHHCLFQYEKNNIRNILLRYRDKKWCGFDNAELFFQDIFHGLADEIKGLGVFNPRRNLRDQSDSDYGDDSPLSLERNNTDEYWLSLQKTHDILNEGFKELSFEKKLDRIIIACKLRAMIFELNATHTSPDKKAQFIKYQFESMKPLFHSELIRDAVKLFCFILLGVVAGVAIGLSAGLAAGAFAASSTIIYTVATAIAGGGCGFLSYFMLFNTHKHYRQLAKDAGLELKSQTTMIAATGEKR